MPKVGEDQHLPVAERLGGRWVRPRTEGCRLERRPGVGPVVRPVPVRAARDVARGRQLRQLQPKRRGL